MLLQSVTSGVRASVRQIMNASIAWKLLGAEIFVGDFLDVRSVDRLCKDSVSLLLSPIRFRTQLADAHGWRWPCCANTAFPGPPNLVMYQSSIECPDLLCLCGRRHCPNRFSSGQASIGWTARNCFFTKTSRASLAAPRARQHPPAAWQRKHHPALRIGRGRLAGAVGSLTGLLTRPAGTAYPIIGSTVSIKEIVGTGLRARLQQGNTSTTKRLPVSNGGSRSSRARLERHAVEHRSSRSGSRCVLPAFLPEEAARFAALTRSKKSAAPGRRRSSNSFASSQCGCWHRARLLCAAPS